MSEPLTFERCKEIAENSETKAIARFFHSQYLEIVDLRERLKAYEEGILFEELSEEDKAWSDFLYYSKEREAWTIVTHDREAGWFDTLNGAYIKTPDRLYPLPPTEQGGE